MSFFFFLKKLKNSKIDVAAGERKRENEKKSVGKKNDPGTETNKFFWRPFFSLAVFILYFSSAFFHAGRRREGGQKNGNIFSQINCPSSDDEGKTVEM